MNAEQIAAQLQALDNEFIAGDIGFSNYRDFLKRLFKLAIALAERVDILEKMGKGTPE